MRSDTPDGPFDERGVLLAMLGYVRATVRAKCEGLDDALARTAFVPTSPLTTVASLVSHVRWVEYSWIQTVFLGEEDRGPWTPEDPDGEMTLGNATPLAQLLDEYDAQSAEYDDLLRTTDLDQLAVRPLRRDGRQVPLRWVVQHLIEETARHNGHLDLLREMADGVTGA